MSDSGVGVDTDQARIKTKMSELLKHSEMFWDPVDAILMSDWWIARETEVSGLVGKLAEAEQRIANEQETNRDLGDIITQLTAESDEYEAERDEALAQLAKVRELVKRWQTPTNQGGWDGISVLGRISAVLGVPLEPAKPDCDDCSGRGAGQCYYCATRSMHNICCCGKADLRPGAGLEGEQR